MNFFIENLYSIVLFPLWVFLIILLGKFFAVLKSKRLISGLTLISTLYGVIFSIGAGSSLINNPKLSYEMLYPFLQIKDLNFYLGFLFDNLSGLLILVVSIVSLLVQFYSYSYMKTDKSFARFFAYLNLFNFSMLGLALSPNLFQMYIFWELVGISSYLLIGFWYKKPSAETAAKKAFIMNRIGDMGLLAGLVIMITFMIFFVDNKASMSIPFSNLNEIGTFLYSYSNDTAFVLICCLLLMGSVAKSAQFPLHTWLAAAMEGPTPVSALIHSATMVAAGVYLIARLYPLFSLNPLVMNIITIIGLVTALFCAFFALTQTDLKRILAYSTNSQLGLMFLALGTGAFTGGLAHLTAHAFIKAMLFLSAGIVMHSLLGELNIKFMGGLKKVLPACAVCYLIGALSLSGVCFSGFASKELILHSFIENNQIFYFIIFLIISFMTALYLFKIYFLVFEGEYRGKATPHKADLILNIPIIVLTLITVILGFFLTSSINLILASISITLAILAIFTAWLLYYKCLKIKKLPILYQLSLNRFYIDNFYNFLAGKVYQKLAIFCNFIDRYILDGVPFLAVLKIRLGSWIFSKMQTGNIQTYIAYSLMTLAIIFSGLMITYTIIIFWIEA